MQSPTHNEALEIRPTTWAWMLALSASGVVLFGLFFQRVFYGDAPFLLNAYRRGIPTGHKLHFYLAKGLEDLGLTPLVAIQAASFVPAGLAVGLLFGGLRRAGIPSFSALLGTLLFCLAPSALFFATTVEVHGLQLFGVALAFFAAVHVALPTAGSGGWFGLVAWGAVAGLSLAATHPMNLPAGLGLGLLLLVGLRARGASRRATQLAAIAGGIGLLGIAVVASYGYLDRPGWSLQAVLGAFAWHFDQKAAASELPAPLFNFLGAVVRPASWLGALGLVGLVSLALGRSRERGAGVGFLIWALVPALLLAGPDFTERGAYFLVGLPALAFGAAHLSARHWGWTVLTLLLLGAQARSAVHAIAAWDTPPPPEAEAWLNGLRTLSAGRGVMLAEDAQQQNLARRYLGMPTDNLLLFLPLPTPDLEAFAHSFADWARSQADMGEPLFLPARVLDLAPEIPPLGLAVEILSEQMEFTPVSAAGFTGYKGS